MDYFIAINGVQQGPFPLTDLIARGMRPDTLVWRAGMPQWQRADSIVELQSLFAAANSSPSPFSPPPSSPPPPPQQPFGSSSPFGIGSPFQSGWPVGSQGAKGSQTSEPIYTGDNNRILAGVLGIVLGGLGIHKFILGMNKQGLIMVLVSVLSFGIGYPVMHVIGLIEGVIYLTKSDAEFYQTYVVGKKPWF